MKFTCTNPNCTHAGQEIELAAEQLVPLKLDINKYTDTGTPFFFTIPPVYCGYCGLLAWVGEVPEDYRYKPKEKNEAT